ncbi:FAD-binding protein [Microbispora sp. NPDC046933]|uniref:FAD-binding protein n=1 Tax=Microbispora sp. NPDC046933 TaxID=3155618 RepID=UPI0033F35F2A
MQDLSGEPAGGNWSGTHKYIATKVVSPRTVSEVQELVRNSRRVRALGTRHSFNDIADTGGVLLSVRAIKTEIELAEPDMAVWAPAGLPYGALAEWLDDRGLAVANLGSLPHISIGGAIAVGTHGSGDSNGNLSSSVTGIEIVTADGDLLRVESGATDFEGFVVGLGALGIVTRVKLAVVPSFEVRQDVYLSLPWRTLLSRLDAVMSAAYSVSVFTRWTESDVAQVWLKSRMGEPFRFADEFHGAVGAKDKIMSPSDEGHDNTTVQGGVAGAWHERLPHFRFDSVPSNGNEIQTEYFVAREDAARALRAVRRLGAKIDPHLLISEFRTVAGDDLWMSPAYHRDSFAIHFTWKNSPTHVLRVLPRIEEALAPFDPRPHWGKWFTLDVDATKSTYERYGDFVRLAERLDPGHKFRNPYLERVLGLPN